MEYIYMMFYDCFFKAPNPQAARNGKGQNRDYADVVKKGNTNK